LLSAAMTASAVRAVPGQLLRLLAQRPHAGAQRGCLVVLPRGSQFGGQRRRSSSSRSPAHFTTWKASRQIFACGALPQASPPAFDRHTTPAT